MEAIESNGTCCTGSSSVTHCNAGPFPFAVAASQIANYGHFVVFRGMCTARSTQHPKPCDSPD